MTEFTTVDANRGFDDEENPPWQMVPLHASRRVRLVGGDGARVRVAHPAIATIAEQRGTNSRGREIVVRGTSVGDTLVEAVDPSGAIAARLHVAIRPRLRRTLSIAFPIDSTGTQSGRPTNATYWRAVSAAINRVYLPQANVEIIFRRVQPRGPQLSSAFPVGMRGQIDVPSRRNDPRPPLWNELAAAVDRRSSYTIVAVPPRFKLPDGRVRDAYADWTLPFAAISDELEEPSRFAMSVAALIAAHEIGHLMGLDHPDEEQPGVPRAAQRIDASPDLLMHSQNGPIRRRLRRIDIDAINPPPSAPLPQGSLQARPNNTPRRDNTQNDGLSRRNR